MAHSEYFTFWPFALTGTLASIEPLAARKKVSGSWPWSVSRGLGTCLPGVTALGGVNALNAGLSSISFQLHGRQKGEAIMGMGVGSNRSLAQRAPDRSLQVAAWLQRGKGIVENVAI
jgi:hypothetical protein